MMSIKLNKIHLKAIVSCNNRLLSSAQSSHKHAIDSKPQELRLTTLPSGLVVASQENYSPISRIAIFIRAGSRYEPSQQLGLTHTLRSISGLTTKRSTAFGITRNVEYLGASISSSTTRDNLIYTLETNRDFTDKNIGYLADIVMESAYKPWEIVDNVYRQKIDLAFLNETPQLILMESLHKAAFRGGLRNSLFSPAFMLGNHDDVMIKKFVDEHFVSNRAAIVAFGVEHDLLLDVVAKRFSLARGDRGQSGESKFIGGEVRVDTNSDITYVAVVCEGVGSKNPKELAALSLFQNILGSGSRIKYNSGTSTKLGKAVSKVTNNPFAVSSVNISYSDTGLFGLSLAAHSSEINKALKAAVTQFREAAKSITEQDVKVAKNILKASAMISNESQTTYLEELGTNILSTGQVPTLKDFENTIDSITVQDVSNIAQRIGKSKGAMASVGKLYDTPYLEDLV